MKKTVLAAAAALLASTNVAGAADMDRELGLIVSGVVDQWVGVQVIDSVDVGSVAGTDTVLANGGEGRLSLPLGESLSIQMDSKYEYNTYATENFRNNDVRGPRYSFQGTGHLSWRDPSTFLLGAFGGAGAIDSSMGRYDISYFGGEAQFYMNDFTLYAQGGYVDFDVNTNPFGNITLDDGLFARGVIRWFVAPDSRLQLEGTYLSAEYDLIGTDMEAFSVGARFDTTLNLPVAGSTPLYVAYRGTFRDNCVPILGRSMDDHTFMVGTSYSFSGDMLTVDRQGATLDTPDFNHACFASTAAISDRRLKTDIVALGTDAAGNKIYSWKYKADPVTIWVGVMAQDLVESHPEALVTRADGFYAVRYDVIGAQMMTLEQWNSRSL